MRTWFRNLRHAFGARRPVRRPSCCPALEGLEQRWLLNAGPGFVATNLVSDIPGLAPHTDPAVVNPWGFTESPRGDFLLSDNGTGTAALFAADGTPLGAPIVIPPPAGSPPGTTAAPTGQVANATPGFVISEGGRSAPAANLFSTEDGTIAGFNSAVDPSKAIIGADQSASGAVYKGLAMGSAGGANYLYATDFHNGTVDVFDTNFALHTFSANQFTDPNPPAGFAPFGVKNINGTLFVTYAKQDDDRHDDVAGPGNGFIDEFDTSGQFLTRFASGTAAGGTLTALNSPFGMAVAPAGFGNFGGDLLVGNFGDSHVSAFDLKTGRFRGQLQDTDGQPLVLNGGVPGPDTKGLWGIAFGNGQGGAGRRTLFFASGPNDESDGVFGMVNMAGRSHGQEDGFPGRPDSAPDDEGEAAGAAQGRPVVLSPQLNDSALFVTTAMAHNDIGAVGGIATGSGPNDDVTLAEHFPAPLAATRVDQFFAAAAKADRPLSFAAPRPRPHEAAANRDLDGLSEGMWLWDRA
jgi:uncharacterized protein (TIGR03118 family)